MDKLEAIKSRVLSRHNQAVIHGLAGMQNNDGIEDQMPAPPSPELKPANSDVELEFYGQRVTEFYAYFKKYADSTNAGAQADRPAAAMLTVAAATLKASVVLGGLIKDLTETIKNSCDGQVVQAKLPYAGKKRGHKPTVK